MLFLAAQVVRSCGGSTVWVYSTLLIQLRVPNELQGRMMALEMALYVVGAPRHGVHRWVPGLDMQHEVAQRCYTPDASGRR